jgi:hypothetical protein
MMFEIMSWLLEIIGEWIVWDESEYYYTRR